MIAPEIIQPESVFRVIVHTFTEERVGARLNLDLHLTVSIVMDGINIRSSSAVLGLGDKEVLHLQIPVDLKNGTYKLQVHGNHPKSTGGTIFNHESNLQYSPKFLSILIQTSRHVYNGDSTSNFPNPIYSHYSTEMIQASIHCFFQFSFDVFYSNEIYVHMDIRLKFTFS